MEDPRPKLDPSALRRLIQNTIEAAGDVSPDELPSHVRRQLERQIAGQPGAEGVLQELLGRARQSPRQRAASKRSP